MNCTLSVCRTGSCAQCRGSCSIARLSAIMNRCRAARFESPRLPFTLRSDAHDGLQQMLPWMTQLPWMSSFIMRNTVFQTSTSTFCAHECGIDTKTVRAKGARRKQHVGLWTHMRRPGSSTRCVSLRLSMCVSLRLSMCECVHVCMCECVRSSN